MISVQGKITLSGETLMDLLKAFGEGLNDMIYACFLIGLSKISGTRDD